MKVTLLWLREFVRTSSDAAGVARRLTLGGLEVESLEDLAADLAGVVVAEIVSRSAHPQASLSICSVRTGNDAPVNVVCGATNMKPGDRVAYAPPGASLPGGVRIEARPVRGVDSFGMLCSEAELGFSDDAAGLLILPRDAPLGERLAKYLGIEDQLLDVSVPANRGDCLSVLGLARDLAALEGSRLIRQRIAVRETGEAASAAIRVRIEPGSGCARYAARIVRKVRVEPSPRWMQWRLRAAGVRPISNVVDVTNYVMLERGQPLHAFDYARLLQPEIVVRRAGSATRFATLDGTERQLEADDLLITTGADPIAIAGVMGGQASEVTSETTTVLLESAWFEPAVVRRTGRRLGLHSESSYRFERGVDIDGVTSALNRAAALLAEIAKGEVAPGIVDVYPEPQRLVPIEVRMNRVSDVLGLTVGKGEVTAVAKALGAAVSPGTRGALTVVPPRYRSDLTREIDVIEEVARLLDYARIAPTMPTVRLDSARVPERMQWVRRLRRTLVARGLSEFMCVTFTSPGANERFPGVNAAGVPVGILNPMSRDEAQLRRSVLPGLLDGLHLNRSQGQTGVAAFSIGKVFWRNGTVYEGWRLAAVVAGQLPERGLGGKRNASFDDAKGVAEAILATLGLSDRVRWQPGAPLPFHPRRSATLACGEMPVGILGAVHPDFESELQVEASDWLLELDLEKLLTYLPPRRLFLELPRFPGVVRDLAIVSDDDFASEQVTEFIRTWGNTLVEGVELFDQYVGAPIPAGRKSLAYTIRYRAADRTLTDEEVNRVHVELTAAVMRALPVELRQ